MKTLYALVTCCLENSRFEVLKQVVDNIRSQPNFNELRESLIVFDNASVMHDEIIGLFRDFKHVYKSNRNVGYWTALKWIVDNHRMILGDVRNGFDPNIRFIYSIESDCIHDRIDRLVECENYLDDNPDVGMIRTQEFHVRQKHLYDKGNPLSISRRYAWQSLVNRFRNNEKVYFSEDTENIYRTNMTAVVCGLSRIVDVKNALNQISMLERLSEADYQKYFDNLYKENAIYDGGLFHSKLSFETGVVAGSRVETHGQTGYRFTQNDRIDDSNSFSVSQLHTVVTQELQQHKTNDGIMMPIYRDWDSWHDNYVPKMLYATTIKPGVRKDVILHKCRQAFITAIVGSVMLEFKHGKADVQKLSLKNDDRAIIVKIPANVPIVLENTSDIEAIIINAPSPAWHPDNQDTIKFSSWDDYNSTLSKDEE